MKVGGITLPQSVSPRSSIRPRAFQGHAEVRRPRFAAGTYKLEVGTTTEPRDIEKVSSTATRSTSATAWPRRFRRLSATTSSWSQAANDVDLYRFEVHSQTDFSVNVTPSTAPPVAPLNARVRIFEADGETDVPFTNSGGIGQAESGTLVTWRRALTTSASRRKATTLMSPWMERRHRRKSTGGYSIQVTFGDLPQTLDDTVTMNRIPASRRPPM